MTDASTGSPSGEPAPVPLPLDAPLRTPELVYDDDEYLDEMAMGQMAVLADVRRRLAVQFGHEPRAQFDALRVVDGYAKEIQDDARWDEEDEDDRG